MASIYHSLEHRRGTFKGIIEITKESIPDPSDHNISQLSDIIAREIIPRWGDMTIEVGGIKYLVYPALNKKEGVGHLAFTLAKYTIAYHENRVIFVPDVINGKQNHDEICRLCGNGVFDHNSFSCLFTYVYFGYPLPEKHQKRFARIS